MQCKKTLYIYKSTPGSHFTFLPEAVNYSIAGTARVTKKTPGPAFKKINIRRMVNISYHI